MSFHRRSSTLAEQVLKNNCVPAGGSGVLVSTDLVRELGGFDPRFSNLADWDLWIRLALAAPATSVRHPLVAYRVHAGGMADGVRQAEEELALITAKYSDERARRGISIDWATWHRYVARLQLRTGDQRAAAHSYLLAARGRPPDALRRDGPLPSGSGPWTWADRRGRVRVPRKWFRDAETWLEEMRPDATGAITP